MVKGQRMAHGDDAHRAPAAYPVHISGENKRTIGRPKVNKLIHSFIN